MRSLQFHKKPRRHRGDIMSPEKRSALMARIKGRGTGPERAVAETLRLAGVRWESHSTDVPGRPDVVFRHAKVAVFIDGDFWHGWRFPVWRDKLSEKWEAKIDANRHRDRLNYQRLRRQGWKVVRIWEHQIERDLEGCVARILAILSSSAGSKFT